MKLSCKGAGRVHCKNIRGIRLDFEGEIAMKSDLPELPEDYSIGVIVGPSGSGKSTLLKTIGTRRPVLGK